MVQGQEDPVLLVLQPKHGRPHKGGPFEIKWLLRLLNQHLPGFFLTTRDRSCPEIDKTRLQLQLRCHHLDRLIITRRKDGPQ